MTRYAVYFTPPPEHPLWRAGCDWLQRDATTDVVPTATRPHIGEPRRYGFHATLKPPMRLAPGRDEASLLDAIARLADDTPRFGMPALSVQWLSDFLALRPVEEFGRRHPLHRLADRCVIELDAWRAPPSAEELQRRLAKPLDTTSRVLLMQYGYPHVLDGWRFHMTLTDARAPEELERAARTQFADALSVPLGFDALSLFVEDAPGTPLRLQQRFPLRA